MSWLDNLDQGLNTFGSDTLGTVYRAATGKVDPWTQNLQESQAYDAVIAAGGTPEQAQAALDSIAPTATSSPASGQSNSSLLGSWFSNLSTDNGTGCSIITNPGGCVPASVWYALLAGGVLIILYVLGPYVGLLERDR